MRHLTRKCQANENSTAIGHCSMHDCNGRHSCSSARTDHSCGRYSVFRRPRDQQRTGISGIPSFTFFGAGKIDVALAAAAIAHTSGDVFLGGGLSAQYRRHPRWFIEASVMPGAYWENEQGNGLGSTFEIRSQLALGYTLKSGDRISIGISHKSNASTAEFNPGVNSLTVRWHFSF